MQRGRYGGYLLRNLLRNPSGGATNRYSSSCSCEGGNRPGVKWINQEIGNILKAKDQLESRSMEGNHILLLEGSSNVPVV